MNMMKNTLLKALLTTSLALVMTTQAAAREISLDEAVEYALQNSPVLKGSAAGVQASSAQVETAEAGRLPKIDLGYGAMVGDNPLFALGSKLNSRTVTAADFDPDQLNDPGIQMTPGDEEIFWRERVRLMKLLVRLRYAQAQRTAF